MRIIIIIIIIIIKTNKKIIIMIIISKEAKYADVDSRFVFEPIAVETLGVFNSSARLLLSDLGRRITNISVEARELSFLFQRVSVLVQRFNAILLHDCLPAADRTD